MISIIIPVFNEEVCIADTVKFILQKENSSNIAEVLVIDGGSTDNTVAEAKRAGAMVIQSPKKGRAAQMNYGALLAKGEIVYFLHADTLPPKSFSEDILRAAKSGSQSGCFMLSFNSDHWLLKANSWFSQFDIDYFRFGDQSLFVNKKVFLQAGGFDEKLMVMEDQEIIKRIREFSQFKIIKKAVSTSARKYLENGIFRTKATFYLIFVLYKMGFSQQSLLNTYRSLIKNNKV